jgi:hypothetical protein
MVYKHAISTITPTKAFSNTGDRPSGDKTSGDKTAKDSSED